MNYQKLAGTAKRLIAATGRPITLVKLSSTPSNQDRPWNGPENPTVEDELETIATFVPAGSGLGKQLVDEELLKRVEQVALIAPENSILESYNLIEDDSKDWKIEWMQVLKPANQVLLHIIGVKR